MIFRLSRFSFCFLQSVFAMMSCSEIIKSLKSNQLSVDEKISLLGYGKLNVFLPDRHRIIINWIVDELSTGNSDFLWEFFRAYLHDHIQSAKEFPRLSKSCIAVFKRLFAESNGKLPPCTFDVFRLLDTNYPQLIQPKFETYFDLLADLCFLRVSEDNLKSYLVCRLLNDMLPVCSLPGKRLFDMVIQRWSSGITREFNAQSDVNRDFQTLIQVMLFHSENQAGFSNILLRLIDTPNMLQNVLHEEKRTAIGYQRIFFQTIHSAKTTDGIASVFNCYLASGSQVSVAEMSSKDIQNIYLEQYGFFQFLMDECLAKSDCPNRFVSLGALLRSVLKTNNMHNIHGQALKPPKQFFCELVDFLSTTVSENALEFVDLIIQICPTVISERTLVMQQMIANQNLQKSRLLATLCNAQLRSGRLVEFLDEFVLELLVSATSINFETSFIEVLISGLRDLTENQSEKLIQKLMDRFSSSIKSSEHCQKKQKTSNTSRCSTANMPNLCLLICVTIGFSKVIHEKQEKHRSDLWKLAKKSDTSLQNTLAALDLLPPSKLLRCIPVNNDTTLREKVLKVRRL